MRGEQTAFLIHGHFLFSHAHKVSRLSYLLALLMDECLANVTIYLVSDNYVLLAVCLVYLLLYFVISTRYSLKIQGTVACSIRFILDDV